MVTSAIWDTTVLLLPNSTTLLTIIINSINKHLNFIFFHSIYSYFLFFSNPNRVFRFSFGKSQPFFLSFLFFLLDSFLFSIEKL